MSEYQFRSDAPTSRRHVVPLTDVEKQRLLRRVALLFSVSILALCTVACTPAVVESRIPQVVINVPMNRDVAWIGNDYATCLSAAGGAMHGELHIFSACMTGRGYSIDLYNEHGTLTDINSLHAAYYYPFSSVEQYMSQFPSAQNHAYAPPDSNVGQTPLVPPEKLTTPQELSNQIPIPRNNGTKPSWQQMFPASTLGSGVESLTGAEARLLDAVRQHPVRLLMAAHPEATAEKSGTHVERAGNDSPVIVDDIMWSKDGHYYGTTFKLTLSRTGPARLDSVKVDVQEINNPWPSAFFYSETTRRVLLGWLLAEYSVPARIFAMAGDELSVKVGLGMVLCYIANNP